MAVRRLCAYTLCMIIEQCDPSAARAAEPEAAREADDLRWMRLALAEAQRASVLGEVPVGAVLLSADGVPLARTHNRPIATQDPSAHAEVLALRESARALGNYRLMGTTLYVTLEPCAMCAGAILLARVARLVFAARDPKGGAVVSRLGVLDAEPRLHYTHWHEGPCGDDSRALLQEFFRARRTGKSGLSA
ncbi:MAG: tRNA adenosine(34) deaminase TadA [Acidithiobacillus sp.]